MNPSEPSAVHKKVSPVALAIAALFAFFVGIGATIAFTSARGHSSTAPPAAKKDADSGGEDEAASDASKRVTLESAAEKTAGIRTEVVAYRPVFPTLSVPGVVQVGTDRVAKITPPVAGKVAEILVRLGQEVAAGQPLIVLDSLEVAQAQAAIRQAANDREQAASRVQTAMVDVKQARNRLIAAREALQRQRALAQAGAFSQSPLQAAQTEQTQAESERLQAQADLENKKNVVARDERLFTAGVVSKQELEQAQTEQRQAQIRLDQAEKRLALATQALERERTVYSRNLLAQQQVQPAEAEVRQAQAEVQKADQEVIAARTAAAGAAKSVENATINLHALVGSGTVASSGRITLRAPIAGVLSQVSATRGEAVSATSTLLVLENLNAVVVQASVPEADAGRVRVGQRVVVSVSAVPQKQFTGIVQSLASGLDEKTRTLTARCLVANPRGLLRPETFAQVQIATGVARRSLLIPKGAVMQDGDEKTVFVVAEGGKGYDRRVVNVGGVIGSEVEITSGLKAGEKVVVQGAFTLKSEARKSELKEND